MIALSLLHVCLKLILLTECPFYVYSMYSNCPLVKKGKTTRNYSQVIKNEFKSMNMVKQKVVRSFGHAGSEPYLYFGLSMFHFMVRTHQSFCQFTVKSPIFRKSQTVRFSRIYAPVSMRYWHHCFVSTLNASLVRYSY